MRTDPRRIPARTVEPETSGALIINMATRPSIKLAASDASVPRSFSSLFLSHTVRPPPPVAPTKFVAQV